MRICKKTGYVQDAHMPIRSRPTCLTENVATVRESMAEYVKLSISRCSQQLGISQATEWRFQQKIKKALRVFKLQLTQKLKPEKRRDSSAITYMKFDEKMKKSGIAQEELLH